MKSWNDTLSDKFVKPVVPVKFSEDKKAVLSNVLFVVSLMSVIPYLILLWRVIDTKKTGGLVLYAFYLAIFISVVWLLYGIFVIENVIVILSSSLLIIVKSVLVYAIIKARSENPTSDDNGDDE